MQAGACLLVEIEVGGNGFNKENHRFQMIRVDGFEKLVQRCFAQVLQDATVRQEQRPTTFVFRHPFLA